MAQGIQMLSKGRRRESSDSKAPVLDLHAILPPQGHKISELFFFSMSKLCQERHPTQILLSDLNYSVIC